MLKISIKKDGVVTNEAQFQTEELCNEWYDDNFDFFPEGHVKSFLSLQDVILEARRDQESTEAIDLGTDLITKIRKINRRKLKLGLWTNTKFNELLASPVAAQVERALWNGSLTTAKYLLTNMSAFYSDIEIQELIAEIDAHELKWIDLI